MEEWWRRLAIWTQAGGLRLRALAGRVRRWGAERLPEGAAPLAHSDARQLLARLARTFGLRGWRSGVAVAASGVGALLITAMALTSGAAQLLPGVGLPEVIGFYQNGWSGTFRSSFPSVRAHYRQLNTVLAFWYSLDGNGHLEAHGPQPGVTAWIKQHHMRMGVLINNVAGSSGNNAGMLTSAAVRHRSVRAIVALAAAQGYQEVNIDFELLPPSARSDLTRFMADLRQALPPSVTLSESVFPKVGVGSSINQVYDYAALAHSVNYLVIMLYDKHSNGGPAGPVSPYPWVVDNMNWFLHSDHIPASKLVLAAGVYGYDWPDGSTQATELPLTAIVALAKREGAKVHTDRASGNPYFTYSSSGQGHVVWYQDSATVRQRLILAKRLHLHGIAIWALGQETPPVWGVIEEQLPTTGT